MADLEHARNAKQALAEQFSADSRVVGIGLSQEDDGYVVQVRLAEAVEDGVLPATIDVDPGPDEVLVRWRVVGPIQPL